MIYVYAITDPLELKEGPQGLQGAALELLEHDGIAGVFSTHDQLEVKPYPELLWAHERVVEHLMQRAGVLPLRFGTMLSDPEALQAVLGEYEARFRVLLCKVRGCVELAVRVGLEPASQQPAAGGADYMRGRLALRRREADAADRVLAPLRPLARATTHRALRGEITALGESYLVPRASVAPFTARVRALQAQHPSLSISCTGPWGPYSFVDGVKG